MAIKGLCGGHYRHQRRPGPAAGPRRVPGRSYVAALISMARTWTLWSLLPAKELGCGSATTCWRRLDEWARAEAFDQHQAVLSDELGAAGRLTVGSSKRCSARAG